MNKLEEHHGCVFYLLFISTFVFFYVFFSPNYDILDIVVFCFVFFLLLLFFVLLIFFTLPAFMIIEIVLFFLLWFLFFAFFSFFIILLCLFVLKFFCFVGTFSGCFRFLRAAAWTRTRTCSQRYQIHTPVTYFADIHMHELTQNTLLDEHRQWDSMYTTLTSQFGITHYNHLKGVGECALSRDRGEIETMLL